MVRTIVTAAHPCQGYRNMPPHGQQQLQVEFPILSEELVVEILSRVHVKPLIRFKCVCKFWNTLITTPFFIKLHLQRTTENYDYVHLQIMLKDHFSCVQELYEVSRSVRSLLDYPIAPIIHDTRYRTRDKYFVVGSCNGVLCVVISNNKIRKIQPTSEKCGVYLWNAATRLRSQKLPCFQVDYNTLVYTMFGFGCDIVSDTYKVVAVHYVHNSDGSHKTESEIFSMGKSYYWRKIRNFPNVVLNEDGVYMDNGTLNWVAISESPNDNQVIMLSFDLEKEAWKKLLLPSGPPYDNDLALVVLRDYLCVWQYWVEFHFVLWQMKEYGNEESWTQLVKISYLDLRIHNLECVSIVPLCMAKNGDLLILLCCISGAQWMMIRYNLRDGIFEHSRIPTAAYIIDLCSKVFIESLVMPC